MIAREAAKMLVEENMVVKNVNTDREEEFGKDVNGYTIGDTVTIKVPPVPVVFDGATFANGGTYGAAAPLLKESSVSLQISTQKHVALTFTAKERTLDLTDFKNRYLRPSMNSLGSIVNADLLTKFKNQTPNLVGTPGTVPATRAVYRSASSCLDRFLAPSDQRVLHFTSDANDALAEANATLFHSRSELEAEFDRNAVGQFAEFTFYKQQSNPLHTNGAGAGYLVNGANQGATLTSVLAVDTGTGAIPAGTIITVTGVNAVHPLTGQSNGKLRQFVVTSDYAGGAGNITISPPLLVSVAPPSANPVIGTINAAPADNAAITIVGAASTAYRQNLGFHRNAFAVAFPPLKVMQGCEGYTASINGVSVRVMTFGDGYQDKENTRIDVLYGQIAVRPDHAIRVTE
jgi:hypothetical protein